MTESETRRIDLEGNIEPEAFSVDGETLVVIEYVPPEAPDRYRVRQLDLASGVLSDVTSPDADLQSEMKGTARTQALAPDGSRLYTLYTLADDGRACVHVLDLADKWAHCVDLPAAFGDPSTASAITVAPGGRQAYVVNGDTGVVVEIDTRVPAVDRVTTLPSAGPATHATTATAAIAASSDGWLYVARGGRIDAVQRSTLEPTDSWAVTGLVRQLRPTTDGRLYLGFADRVALVSRGQSEPEASFRLRGAESLTYLGPGDLPVPPGLTAYECAC